MKANHILLSPITRMTPADSSHEYGSRTLSIQLLTLVLLWQSDVPPLLATGRKIGES